MSKIRLKYSPKTGLIYRSGYTGRQARFNGPTKGRIEKDGYREITVDKVTYKFHRLVFSLMGVDIPKDMEVDHKNGIRDDNRWDNLRLVTKRQNQQNLRLHRQGKLVGCYYCNTRKKWHARIKTAGKVTFLGHFETEKEAHEAYKQALKELECR